MRFTARNKGLRSTLMETLLPVYLATINHIFALKTTHHAAFRFSSTEAYMTIRSDQLRDPKPMYLRGATSLANFFAT